MLLKPLQMLICACVLLKKSLHSLTQIRQMCRHASHKLIELCSLNLQLLLSEKLPLPCLLLLLQLCPLCLLMMMQLVKHHKVQRLRAYFCFCLNRQILLLERKMLQRAHPWPVHGLNRLAGSMGRRWHRRTSMDLGAQLARALLESGRLPD